MKYGGTKSRMEEDVGWRICLLALGDAQDLQIPPGGQQQDEGWKQEETEFLREIHRNSLPQLLLLKIKNIQWKVFRFGY